MNEILLVEDDPHDLELTMAAFLESKSSSQLVVTRDGQEALDYLHCTGAFHGRDTGNPSLVLLDLKLPKVDGLEVLATIKADPALKLIPVVMLTSSKENTDVWRSYSTGANAYVVKPMDLDSFFDSLRKAGVFWTTVNQAPPAA